MPRALSTLAAGLVRRRWWWVAGLGVVAALSAGAASRLQLSLRSDDFLPDHGANTDPDLEAALAPLSRSYRMAVVLESAHRIDTADVRQVFEYLAPRLAAVPGVLAAEFRLRPELRAFRDSFLPRQAALYLTPADLHLAAARLSPAHIAGAIAAADTATVPARRTALIPALAAPEDPLGILPIAARAAAGPAGTSRITLRSGYFSLIDGRRFFLLVEADAGEDRAAGLARVVAGIERALAEARAAPALAGALRGSAVYATGLPVENVYLFNTIRGDILRIGIGASVLVLLLLTLYYRRWYAPLVLFAPIAYGLLVATGIAALVFPSISIVAWTFLGVQVGLGVDFGIHIATHYWLRSRPGAGRTASLRAALQRPGRGIVFGAITSAAAFLSLLVASYPILREIAWLTAIGLLAILAASFTVLPLALSFTAPGVRRPGRGERWLGRVTALSPRAAVAGLGLLLLGGALAAPHIPLQTDPWRVKARGDVRAARLEQLSRDAGTSFAPLYLVSTGETAEQAIERDRAAVRRLKRVALDAGVASIESVSWLLPAPADQRASLAYIREDPEQFAARRVTADFRRAVGRMNHPRPHLLTDYLPAIVRALPGEPREITLGTLRSAGLGPELDRHMIRAGERWLSVSYIYLRQLPVAPGVMDRFIAVTHRAGLDGLPGVRIQGRSLRVAAQAAVLKGDAVRATLVALVVVLAILLMQFRSIRLMARCLVPLVAGIAAILLVMASAGIPLTLLTLAVAPILLGIGVDDGIHVVERQRRADSREAILREAGASMVLTTLTTVAAFACLGLARFGGLGEVGFLGSVGMAAALVGALVGGQAGRRTGGQAGRRAGMIAAVTTGE